MTSISRLRWFPATLALASIAALAVVLPPWTGSASAADNGSWSVTPTTVKDALPRQYFIYELTPGVTLRDSVTLVNELDVPQTFLVYPTDGFTTSRDGAIGFRAAADLQQTIGAWTTVLMFRNPVSKTFRAPRRSG